MKKIVEIIFYIEKIRFLKRELKLELSMSFSRSFSDFLSELFDKCLCLQRLKLLVAVRFFYTAIQMQKLKLILVCLF